MKGQVPRTRLVALKSCVALFCLAVAACASQPIAEQRADRMQQQIAKGDYAGLAEGSYRDFIYTDTDSLGVQRKLAALKPFKPAFIEKVKRAADEASIADDVEQSVKVIHNAAAVGLLSADESNALLREVQARISKNLANGVLKLDLTDQDALQQLGIASHTNMNYLFKNSMQVLEQDGERTGSKVVNLRATLEYVQKTGQESPEYKFFESRMPSLQIAEEDFNDSFKKMAPELAERYRKARATRLVIHTDPADRLLEEDVKEHLKAKIPYLEFLRDSDPESCVVTVGRLQLDRREEPERKQTITYRDYEVNMLAAVLLMPKNASYQYDYVTGGAEVDAAYLIRLERNGKVLTDRVYRDRKSDTYVDCENPRIVNVFGGVQKAEFVANDDMKNRCSGSSTRPDARQMESEILDDVADQIVNELHSQNGK